MNRQVTTLGAILLGIGSMVGAGVFALMGVAAGMAGSAIWVSFLAAGVIAGLTGHTFVQLGVRYPSRGGIVEYLMRAYGSGRFSGGCSILFYIAQLIGMAMISLAFGKFTARLLGIEDNELFWERVFGSSLILVITVLALKGSTVIRNTQRTIVTLNLALLTVFMVVLAGQAEVSKLSVDTWPDARPILGSLALTFFAFTGFAVISNTAEDMENPSRDLPRAMYSTILIVTILYVGLALAVTSAVSADQLHTSGAMLLVVAARSTFGEVGYIVLLLTAIAATVTALNGGIFGTANITFRLAELGQLPSRFKQEVMATTRGMTISVFIALIMVNFMSLAKVASLGSATSLLVYSLVNFGALRLITEKGLHRILIILSLVACIFAVLVWVAFTLKHSPDSLFIFGCFLAFAFAAEGLIQRFIRKPESQEG